MGTIYARGEQKPSGRCRRVEDEERSRKAIENDSNALQHAVLEVVTDKEIISINVRFDIILGK